MRSFICIVTGLALAAAAVFAAAPALAKHKSHKAPKTEYMRAVPSTPPAGH